MLPNPKGHRHVRQGHWSGIQPRIINTICLGGEAHYQDFLNVQQNSNVQPVMTTNSPHTNLRATFHCGLSLCHNSHVCPLLTIYPLWMMKSQLLRIALVSWWKRPNRTALSPPLGKDAPARCHPLSKKQVLTRHPQCLDLELQSSTLWKTNDWCF